MKYTAEKVRDYADACRLAHKGPVIADMLTELAERIEAAKVDPAAKPHTLADFVHASDAERAQIGQQVAARVDGMMAEPVAPSEAASGVDLHDRIEFALRDAGFGLDEASTLAERATAEPAAQINRLNLLEDTLFQISVRLGEVREPDMDDMSWYTQLIARAQFLAAIRGEPS